MAETFLILLAGGVMLAGAVSDPMQVTLNWLRLCGVIALTLTGVAFVFLLRRGASSIEMSMFIAVAMLIVGQVATVQVAWRSAQRLLCGAVFAAACVVGAVMIGEISERGFRASSTILGLINVLAATGISAMTGLALMDMLLGHAYLTASQMTMSPFMRLNRILQIVLVLRALCAVIVAPGLQAARPINMFWGAFGLYVLTRWLVGLIVPGVFVWMAHDCIKRRATQSATGILYVAGVLIFIGEIIALYLVRETGLPF